MRVGSLNTIEWFLLSNGDENKIIKMDVVDEDAMQKRENDEREVTR